MTRTVVVTGASAGLSTPVAAARGAYGLLVTVAGPRIGARVAGRPLEPAERLIVRVLGARHVVQAVVSVLAPSLARPGALVDAGHAASLLGIAALRPGHRRLALADLPAATLFAVFDGRVD